MYFLINTSLFDKDYYRCLKRGLKMQLLDEVFYMLENGISLPQKYKAHKLKGKYKNCIECHIKGDWLLIWLVDETKKEIHLIRTGTHSDLFK